MKCSHALKLVAILAVTSSAAPLPSRISPNEIADKSAMGLRLISIEENVAPVWKTEDDVFKLIQGNVGFLDVTETYLDNWEIEAKLKAQGVSIASNSSTSSTAWPAISQQTTVKGVIALLKIENLQEQLAKLSAFHTRYYKSLTGVESSNHVMETLKGFAAGRTDVTVEQYTHSFPQKSVIVKFAGKVATAPIAIFGAHQDSVGSTASGRSPGADDDGSGSVSLMEAMRGLIEFGYMPNTPLEFHWYAGEEGGLLGSQAIANQYIKDGKKVKAYMNFDMTGYFQPGSKEVIALFSDRVDSAFTAYAASLVGEYCSIPAGTGRCGYGCSDHASWYAKGVPAAFPFEAPMPQSNKNIHKVTDTVDIPGFSWTHALEFTKLAVATAIELTAV